MHVEASTFCRNFVVVHNSTHSTRDWSMAKTLQLTKASGQRSLHCGQSHNITVMTPAYDIKVMTNDDGDNDVSCRRPVERYVISQKGAIVRDSCPQWTTGGNRANRATVRKRDDDSKMLWSLDTAPEAWHSGTLQCSRLTTVIEVQLHWLKSDQTDGVWAYHTKQILTSLIDSCWVFELLDTKTKTNRLTVLTINWRGNKQMWMRISLTSYIRS